MTADALEVPASTPDWQNALGVEARGIELLLQRRSASRLSGWLSYAYARTRVTDGHTGERYDGDGVRLGAERN